MIEIFRPMQSRALKQCKLCDKSDFVRNETITLCVNGRSLHRWNFHNECFAKLREQMLAINIFKVPER